MKAVTRTALALLCLLTLGCARGQSGEPLRGFGADVSSVGVSGVSSGGYMAVQFHVAHSAMVHGAGVLAAGPYYCAQGNAAIAKNNCMVPDLWAPVTAMPLIKTETDALAALSAIDATSNLRRARVWLFSGTKDETVLPVVVDALAAFYRLYVPAASIKLVQDVPAGHGMVTRDFGVSCGATQAPFLNNCHFDAAGQLLGHIHGPLNPPSAEQTGRLFAFDQREFADGNANAISMADTGYVYVPRSCQSKSCRVHAAFHGCRQSAQAEGLSFVNHAGYNRWADSNALIIVYPQTIARYGIWGWPPRLVFNPRGCWDWWGYTGADYHTHTAPQIRAVKAMIDRLGQRR